MITEYEIKSFLSESLKKRLLSDYKVVKQSLQVDVYYDNVSSLFFEKGIFLRIRDDQSFDIKYNPDILDLSHSQCREYNYKNHKQISKSDLMDIFNFLSRHNDKTNSHLDFSSLNDIFEIFELQQFVKIEKDRFYLDMESGVECVIDVVSDLGSFIELEVNDQSKVEKITTLCSKFDLENIPVGYVELWLRKHNFEIYSKGRYLLDVDR